MNTLTQEQKNRKRIYNREWIRKWRANNPEQNRAYERQLYKENREEIRIHKREYYAKNAEKLRSYHQKWRKANPAIVSATQKKHRANNINARIGINLRVRLREAVFAQNGLKRGHFKNILNISVQELRKHLEKQFQTGMSWQNYGYYGWHIDHIKPLAIFDLTKVSEQKKAFHYTNLQPLWAADNFHKHDKVML